MERLSTPEQRRDHRDARASDPASKTTVECAAVPEAYREFYYPLNVFMHILMREEGGVTYLHYGLFDRADESIGAAQEHSTELLLARLPSPPASILDVGVGIGTTLSRLTSLRYDVTGITPDSKQLAMVKSRFGDAVRVELTQFETITPSRAYDCVVFQESAQYIDSEALFSKARELTGHIIVLDEFATQPLQTPGSLHSLTRFVDAAARNAFHKTEELDLSLKAAPSIDYFRQRIPRYRQTLIDDLGVTSQQVDELIANGERNRDLYARGTYVYRLLQFRRRS